MNKIMILFIGILTFSVQLLSTKSILGDFGGSASVWIGSLMFFQMGLFISYSLTHYYIQNSTRFWAVAALSLVTNSLFIFNVIDTPSFPKDNQIMIILGIFVELTLNFGLTYISLLMVSPLIQKQTEKPYELYIYSNAGAFIGLLAYPFVIEPFIGLKNQSVLFIFGSLAVFLWAMKKIKSPTFTLTTNEALPSSLSWKVASWSALGTVLLGSFSSYLIQDLVSFPLLWVLPLSLYLATFIFAFSNLPKQWLTSRQRNILEILILISLADVELGNVWTTMIIALIIFSIVMIIVNIRLSSLAPVDKKHLTSFYFMVAGGGLIGGTFVNLIVPYVFVNLNEYIFFLVVLLGVLHFTQSKKKLTEHASLAIIVIIFVTWQLYTSSFVIDSKRSFYGTILVKEAQNRKVMFHGNIIHGEEEINYPSQPTSYYQVPMVEHFFKSSPKSIALVGVGAGVLLTYPSADAEVDAFEIDPKILELAHKHFTFIKSARAKVNFIINDGRKGLENSSKTYDLIIIDAFSGDSIPSHLLTSEAFKLYRQKLSPKGRLAIHISNRYLGLTPIVQNSSGIAGFSSMEKVTVVGEYRARWVELIPSEITIITNPEYVWTDDFSSLWNILKID